MLWEYKFLISSIGFYEKSKWSKYVYQISWKGHVLLVSLYVDDLIITGNWVKLIDGIKVKSSQVFEMKDLGELHYCLGLEFLRVVGQTFVSHGKYVR